MPTGVYKRVITPWNKDRRIVKCFRCGVDIEVSPSRVGIKKFCSRRCSMVGTARHLGHKHSEQAKEKMRASGTLFTKGFTPWNKGIPHSEEVRQKLRNNHWSKKPGYKMSRQDTDIERIFEEGLKSLGLKYQKQVVIPGVGSVDFLLDNRVVVECDGEYWHSLPRAKKHDPIKTKQLQDIGYKVYRFWGKDIKNNLASCINQINLA